MDWEDVPEKETEDYYKPTETNTLNTKNQGFLKNETWIKRSKNWNSLQIWDQLSETYQKLQFWKLLSFHWKSQ